MARALRKNSGNLGTSLLALGSWMDPGPFEQISTLGYVQKKLAGGGKRCAWALGREGRSPLEIEQEHRGRL